MKFHKNKFLTTVAAAALALAVGACSSNGDDDEISMLQTDLDAATAKAAGLQEDLDEANTALMTAQADLMTANGMVTTLEGQLETATDMVTALETLIGDEMNPDPASVRGMLAQANLDLEQARTDLQMAMDNSADEMEIARLTQAVTDAEGMRDGYKTMLDAANLELDGDGTDANEGLRAKVTRLEGELADANAEIADIKEKAKDALAALALKEKIARATEVSDAIDASTNDTDPIAMPTITDVTGVTAKRDAAGAVTFALAGADEDEFTGGDASAGTVWTGGTLMRTNDDDSEDTIVVYSDVEAPTPTTLGLELTQGSISISSADQRGRIVPTDAPSGDAELAYATNDKFKGTYRGIAGTFECTGGSCTVSLDAKKKPVVGENDALNFVPDSIGDTYDAPDAAYAYFGWWLSKPEKEDAAHTVEVFSGAAGNVYPGADVADLEGKATYKGPAAGKYATKTITAGALSDAEAGHFTAAATLTANFDADSTPDTEDNDGVGNISGTVTDFELSGEVNSGAWKLTLGTAPLTANVVTFSGATDVDFGGGKETGAGIWQGSFYNDTDTDATDDAPGTVAGTFSATTGGASLLGGFGATK